MSELQQARQHLKHCQYMLRAFRRRDDADRYWSTLEDRERDVLAALSWVWDAQERDGLNPPEIIYIGPTSNGE